MNLLYNIRQFIDRILFGLSHNIKYLAFDIYYYWLSKGLTSEVACGLIAQAYQESLFNCNAMGDHDQAYGVFQWHPTRVDAIKAGCGINLRLFPDLYTQLEAAWWELNNPEKHALEMIKTAKTAYDAGALASQYWERPKAPDEADKRGKIATYWYNKFNN